MKQWNLDIIDYWVTGTGCYIDTYAQSSKLFERFLKIIALAYIYQLAKFGDLMSCGLKETLKKAPCLMYNTHHDVTDLVNHGMVKS